MVLVKQIGPILEEISTKCPKIIIAKHNIDQEPNTANFYAIRGIPTMLLFKSGELKATKGWSYNKIKYCFLDKRKYLIHT